MFEEVTLATSLVIGLLTVSRLLASGCPGGIYYLSIIVISTCLLWAHQKLIAESMCLEMN